MSEAPVYRSENDDEMKQANENARLTFRYFWRELFWEYCRIVPALDLATVKAPFSDKTASNNDPDDPSIEHMWVSDIVFDGKNITGTLLNTPHALTSVREGDTVRFPFKKMGDWMYCRNNEVYGAHTVNLIRSRMSSAEREQHDAAWDLDFGAPNYIRIIPQTKTGFHSGLLRGKKADLDVEHPMSAGTAEELKEQLTQDRSLLRPDKRGWTLLHHHALAGNADIVAVLLKAGADPNAVTRNGATPLKLAKVLGWKRVIEHLTST